MKLVSREYAGAVVLAPDGRLDHDNSEAFRAALQPHLDAAARPQRGVVLDLSRLEYVSSAGLRCFVLAAKQAKAQGGRVVITAMQPVVAEIFQISRFNLVFDIYSSVRDALAALSADATDAFDRA
jgi:anti-sigma B factor antagonist